MVVCATASTAFAQDAAVEAARKQFDAANQSFSVGDFAKAAGEYMAAYQTKAFPVFLFNAAVCYEKSGDLATAAATFERYLAESPKAADKAEVQKRVAELKQKAAGGGGADVLPEIKRKGVVHVETTPPGAQVYLDNTKDAPLGETPWQGSLVGAHTVILVARGYETVSQRVEPSADQFIKLIVPMKADEKLGWLEVSANIPGASVYLDRKERGAVGVTPFRNNVEKGKHTLYITKEGYQEATREVEIKPGEVHKIDVTLEEARVGFVRVRSNVTGARVELDGNRVPDCPRAPCRFAAKEGTHELVVDADGKKEYEHDVRIQAKTETIVQVTLANSPSRWDAGLQFILAGGFAVGGYFIFTNAHAWGKKDNSDDNRFPGGPTTVKVTAGVVWALGAFSLGRGIYFLMRDKGPPSTGTIEAREMAWQPVIGPGYAGFSAGLRF